ncbi:NUDIX hydrolase [Leptodesmis sichuanensis]|uniref:NUDIX hydrolase n=1 Tax=Leptodesmis sichuanensis TaxID=2906798 RepID=UPI001F2266DB|nr:NUDIX hydrolase [Leptodesmis sichuanensis]UIE39339.1 NUDIX hydrolase [Leptodesmis sichuanensis A121]
MRRLWHFAQAVLGILFRHPVTGTSVIPILPDGRIVLIQRSDTGKWALPGGMVNWGEDIATSIQRELEEETGLEVARICRLVGVYSSPERDGRVHSICVVVEVQATGSLKINDPVEVIDVQAFTPADIPIGTLSHDHDRQLKDYFAGHTTLA